VAGDNVRIIARRPVSTGYKFSRFVELERMRTLGFWPIGEPMPLDPPPEAAERAQIGAELARLRANKGALQDPEKALAAERVRRWEESKASRARAKADRAERHASRRAAWDAERAGTIVHVGPGHNQGLQGQRSIVEVLTKRG